MESTWEAELSSTGVLLLSGMPRVGKSYSARWVGAEFESQGYEVLESSDISQVERFLDDPTKAQRLAILDDPLGSASTVAASVSVLDQIEKLITRLRLQRKLIVAQGTPQLLATARASALSQVLSAGKSWHDLGTHCASLLLGVWQAAVAAYDVPRPLASFVYDALSTSSLKLEPGCLEHLAANHNRLERKLDLANISRLAREPSKRFGHALAETGHEAILSTLAVTTVAQDRITVGELAFTMGSGGSALPGNKILSVLVCLSGNHLP